MSMIKPRMIMSDKKPDEKHSKNEGENKPKPDSRKAITKALELCKKYALFYNQNDHGFAVVKENGINRVFKIQSNDFKKYLNAIYYQIHQMALNSNVLKEVIDVLDAKACFEGDKKQTYVRIANLQNKIYIDLCNASWQCVEIDGSGFRVLNISPVMFERKSGMTALPIPVRDGDVMRLKEFVNVPHEIFPLIVAWILGALRGIPPFPILMITGGQGSGKSTFTEMLRKIIDPSEVLLRGVIKEEGDLVVSAKSSYMVVMDNISKMSSEMADRLCQMSTGGGFTKRKLYSDYCVFRSERTIFRF